jgi:hypothetical protein
VGNIASVEFKHRTIAIHASIDWRYQKLRHDYIITFLCQEICYISRTTSIPAEYIREKHHSLVACSTSDIEFHTVFHCMSLSHEAIVGS